MKKTERLYFIDAIRAWAIIMMLQGHFIDGLLAEKYRNSEHLIYQIWSYFRGITAPVFFTVSGFIFTYLLFSKERSINNPRIKKGLYRGVQLLGIGYLLRLNILGLFIGEIYPPFYQIDVLHCIGISLITLTLFYLGTLKYSLNLTAYLFLFGGLLIFSTYPYIDQLNFNRLPLLIANYFTKSNGSVFIIIPWLGYTLFGSSGALLFKKHESHTHFYKIIIPAFLSTGLFLIFNSRWIFYYIFTLTNLHVFEALHLKNYLFVRLGDVFVVFAVFITLRQLLTTPLILTLGKSTLTIYIIHYIILYGSFIPIGLYGLFKKSLFPSIAIPGAIFFIVSCSYIALFYTKNKEQLKVSTLLKRKSKKYRIAS